MRHSIIEADLARITAAALPWQDLRGSTVLITGANGFLPAYMVETLLYLNERVGLQVRVLALVRNLERAAARFAHYAQRPDLEFVVQDVCAPLRVAPPVDYIIHAASQASPKYYGKDPVGTLNANVLGTSRLLELAQQRGARGFLFFSSGEVYGRVREDQYPVREDSYGYLDPTDVRACYGESKRLGETLCVCWHAQYGVPAKIVRPSHTYGPGMKLDDGRVFADFVADIVGRRDIVLKSDGRARRPFCYLADAVMGYWTVLLKGGNAQAYNVANPSQEVSILQLAETLAALFPERRLKVVRQEGGAPAGYLRSANAGGSVSIDKIRSLGWEPSTTIEEGFRKTVASFE